MWAMIKPWLDPVTKDKFHVLGSNYQSTLLEYIDADMLPRLLGGTCECPGAHCVGPLQYHLLPDKTQ